MRNKRERSREGGKEARMAKQRTKGRGSKGRGKAASVGDGELSKLIREDATREMKE